MNRQEKIPERLLELRTLTEPRNRAGQIQCALRTALALTDGDAAVIQLPRGQRMERLVMYAGSPAPAKLPAEPQGSPIARHLLESAEPVTVVDVSKDTQLGSADACPGIEAGPVLFTALRQRDPAPAYLAVYRRQGRVRFAQAEIRSMLLLCAWLSMALECLRLASGSEKLALGDDLTGVYNARFLKVALQRELRRAGRFGQEVALALVDVDRLGQLDEEHGELRGSILRRELAALLSEQVRSFDLLTRYRGDQFMVVLPQTGRDGALEVAERIRSAVEGHAFSSLPAGAVTVSLAVAAFPKDGMDGKALCAAVEHALAQARQSGTNRGDAGGQRAA